MERRARLKARLRQDSSAELMSRCRLVCGGAGVSAGRAGQTGLAGHPSGSGWADRAGRAPRSPSPATSGPTKHVELRPRGEGRAAWVSRLTVSRGRGSEGAPWPKPRAEGRAGRLREAGCRRASLSHAHLASPPSPAGRSGSSPRRSPGSRASAATSRPRRSAPPADLARAGGAREGWAEPWLRRPCPSHAPEAGELESGDRACCPPPHPPGRDPGLASAEGPWVPRCSMAPGLLEPSKPSLAPAQPQPSPWHLRTESTGSPAAPRSPSTGPGTPEWGCPRTGKLSEASAPRAPSPVALHSCHAP